MAKTSSYDAQLNFRDAKMKCVALLLVSVVGSSFAYYIQRDSPYNIGPNDPYQLQQLQFNPYLLDEPSQRLFWGSSGSNSVGSNGGFWSSLTNKFPFLGNWFGRMELQPTYGVPSTQYGVPSTQYGAPVYTQYAVPNYQPPQFYYPASNQVPRTVGRDVGVTDDAVIITPPNVPINRPIPIPEPAGYNYNKPQNRLELPLK